MAQLEGIAVLDLSSVGPAARAARILADYGAEVVKVEPTRARAGVQIRPPFHSYAGGRGFRRIRLDLKRPGGRDAFLRLAERADVVLESMRPGVMDRLGIGYEAVSERNPGVVYCSTSGFGQEGPSAQWAGHDIDYLAFGGFLACSTPGADGAPPIPGATVADAAGGGMHAVIAILAALLRRQATGRGQRLDVAAVDGVLSLMSLAIDQYLATGEEPGPRRDLLTGRYACYDVYRARDGKWLAVGAIEPHFFANLCRALGLERFIENQTDDARQEEIRGAFREAFARRERDEWVAELAPLGTCVAPVYTIAELVEDPHLRARGSFVEAEHPERGRFRQLAPPLAGSDRPAGPIRLRGAEASDAESLLREAGLGDEEIAALRASGAVE